MQKINPELFTHVGKNLEAAQAIKRPSLSYFKDALRRIKKNLVAVTSFWVLVLLLVMSIIGPVISKTANDHDYRKQDLSQQNQTPFLNNARSITMTANDVFSYKTYTPNIRKSKIVFTEVRLKSAGKIGFRIGNAAEESLQGDKKEFPLQITIDGTDNWNSILDKLNAEGERLLESDPDFRGIHFERKGNQLVVTTNGEKSLNSRYWFGTDQFGRDLFTRLWEGGRVSFFIALISVLMTGIFGMIYGGIAGYVGGTVDNIMMRIVEVLMTVPDMLYIILLMTVMKPGLWPITIVLIATSWMGTARIVRGEVMRLKHSEYVMAAQTLGASSSHIIMNHLLPNTMGPILVNLTMMIPRMIFAEAFLSFIGLGMPVPFASWGVLVNEGAKLFRQYPHQLIVPAIVISLTMLGFNLLGDGLRDALDPKLRK